MFISDIGLQFSFFVTSLSGFGIRVMVASQDEFGSVPPSAIFWKSLRRIGVSSSLNVSQNSPVKPSALCTPVVALSSVALKHPPCHPLSPSVKGLHSVWKPFLLHSSLPEVQVPSLFFCLCFFFFLLPYPGMWRVSCLLGSLRPSAGIQQVFCRSCSTCRCVFYVYVGWKVISMSYSSAMLKVLQFPQFLYYGASPKYMDYT